MLDLLQINIQESSTQEAVLRNADNSWSHVLHIQVSQGNEQAPDTQLKIRFKINTGINSYN